MPFTLQDLTLIFDFLPRQWAAAKTHWGAISDTVQVIVGFLRLFQLRLKVKVPKKGYFPRVNSIPLTNRSALQRIFNVLLKIIHELMKRNFFFFFFANSPLSNFKAILKSRRRRHLICGFAKKILHCAKSPYFVQKI